MALLRKRATWGAFAVLSFLSLLPFHPVVSAAQSLEEAKKLQSQMGELYNQGRYREAIPIAQRILAI